MPSKSLKSSFIHLGKVTLEKFFYIRRSVRTLFVLFSKLTASEECYFSLCKPDDAKSWVPCPGNVPLESEISRGPSNMGPARRVAERSFLIVTGE